MGSFYLITYSSSIGNAEIIKDRIRQYEDSINFLDSSWFVYSEDGAEAIYKKLSKGGFENDRFLVMHVDFSNYWGRLHKSVWEWIKKDRGEK